MSYYITLFTDYSGIAIVFLLMFLIFISIFQRLKNENRWFESYSYIQHKWDEKDDSYKTCRIILGVIGFLILDKILAIMPRPLSFIFVFIIVVVINIREYYRSFMEVD